MNEQPITISSAGATLRATLTLPDAPIRGGLVPLHPASEPSSEQFLFRQLAELLPPRGVAVLRYDRRSTPDGGDVPLEVQARDALAALDVLRSVPGVGQTPLGLWGFSQGAWAAPLAASLAPDQITFLALIAATGVTPALQMRYGVAEQVRRAGYEETALKEVEELRATWEAYLRGALDHDAAQVIVARLASRPWFPLTYVPSELPYDASWPDMDFDPAPIFAAVNSPTLLFYGEDDEWTPVDASVAAWRAAAPAPLTVMRLPGASHYPTLNGERDIASISPLYTQTLLEWLEGRLPPLA
jgi:pimeloyl-ACP methyl ester carboxylesterase